MAAEGDYSGEVLLLSGVLYSRNTEIKQFCPAMSLLTFS